MRLTRLRSLRRRRTHEPTGTRVLVAGWFSFLLHGATAGDLLARDLACDWLRVGGRAFDVADASPFEGGIAVPSLRKVKL